MGDRQGHAHPAAARADKVALESEKLGQGIGAWLRYAEQRAPQLCETRVPAYQSITFLRATSD
jgi:hypothetical protein